MDNLDWGNILFQAVIYCLFFKLGQASIIHKVSKAVIATLEKKGIDVKVGRNGELEFGVEEMTLDIERVENQYFAYSGEGQFLGQGADFTGLFESLKKQYPDQNFRINAVESNFSEDEIKQMVKDAIEVFGDKKHADSQTRQ
jgi:hypothetical protein